MPIKDKQSLQYAIMALGSLAFLLAIFLPLIVGIAERDKDISELENRSLVQLPNVPKTFSQLDDFPNSFNDYYADQFGFREEFNYRHSNLERKYLEQSSSSPVTLGKDNWLFLGTPSLNPSDYHNPFSDVQKIDVYTPKQLNEAVGAFSRINNYLKERGIHYIFVIAPNKHTIYSDKLPTGVKIKNGPSAMDQLITALRKETEVHVVDLRPALFAAKEWSQIYYRYDSHWNSLGANIAQHTIMWELAKQVQGAPKPFLLTPYFFAFHNDPNFGDLLKIYPIEGASSYVPKPIFKGVCVPNQTSFRAPNKSQGQRSETECSTGKLDALIFRDSFYGKLAPFLLRQFAHTTAVFDSIDRSELETELRIRKPNLIIEQIVERKLPYVPDFN